MSGRGKKLSYGIFTLLVIVVFFAIYLWHPWNRTIRKLTDKDLALEMQARANQAIEMAESDYGITLDYSAESVVKVEEILGKIHELHESEPLSQDQLIKESLKWGGYVGETIRSIKPCHWELDSRVGGEGSFPIVFESEQHEIFPISWCYKRIINGPEDNVWHKFTVCVLEDATKNFRKTPK
jgi:hypothetical protein